MSDTIRIAIGGIRHETNTFSPLWTRYNDFRIVRGSHVLRDELEKIAQSESIELIPTFVARAMPGGLVAKAAYIKLKEELLNELQKTLPADGLYLDLHGAMEVEEIGDGEGDLVSSIRELAGRDVLISVSLDLHGNISPALIENSDILTAFRTAPHRDYEETRRRALLLLVRALKDKLKPKIALIKLPLLLSGEQAITDVEPAKSLYEQLNKIDSEPGIIDSSFLIGCAWTDSVHTCVSIIVVAEYDKKLATEHASKFARDVWAKKNDFSFDVEVASIDESISRAMDSSVMPVFISDSGDNVTGGGAGDIPLFAERLLALGAKDALVAGLCDLQAVGQCADAGEGALIELTIGGKLDPVNGRSLSVKGRVERLRGHDGCDTALVSINGIHIILTSERRAFTDIEAIAATGVDLFSKRIVVVKQGYLFPGLCSHAKRIIMALSPGATNLHLKEMEYKYLSRPVFPLDKEVEWSKGY